jgi:hypothetical protein
MMLVGGGNRPDELVAAITSEKKDSSKPARSIKLQKEENTRGVDWLHSQSAPKHLTQSQSMKSDQCTGEYGIQQLIESQKVKGPSAARPLTLTPVSHLSPATTKSINQQQTTIKSTSDDLHSKAQTPAASSACHEHKIRALRLYLSIRSDK